ncbi:hypothetical protein [Paracoccus laeviglucosivorans]|uniref:Uncharacterized protein n=1 Tax=Paracoccus laeviglucosivorans TaxID=1197861 RepID=A0A521D2D9_9RHOB|nr:hypothetical protein [Paracoccus laeviglucosivorans]SMO65837.1 hypothetical protein SAMN06265221_10610 [Paracoccus laeviglucosivorans]
MRGPDQLGPYPERGKDCERALEDGVLEIVEQAASAGWMREEIWAALSALIHDIRHDDR